MDNIPHMWPFQLVHQKMGIDISYNWAISEAFIF